MNERWQPNHKRSLRKQIITLSLPSDPMSTVPAAEGQQAPIAPSDRSQLTVSMQLAHRAPLSFCGF
jgi:hypothetical protein